MRLPPDFDRLAWSVAESGDPKLRAEFARRHPEHAEEMERRAKLVDDRGETPAHASAGIALPPRAAQVPIWASVLVGLAVGAVAISLFIPRRPAADPEVLPITTVGTTATERPTTNAPVDETPATTPQDIPPVSTARDPRTPTSAGSQPTTMRLQGTGLHDALALLAAAGDLRLRIDSDVADPEVAEEFADLTPRQMIDALGGEYGFRVVEEAPGSLVIVPLGEPSPIPENVPEGPADNAPNAPATPPNDADFPIFANENR